MKPSDIKSVIESRFKKIKDARDKIIKHFGTEEIHDFRVEVKKLRAFMRLAATPLTSPVKLKIPYQLNSLYRSVGNIRTLQLQRQRIFEHIKEKECGEPTQYLQILLDQQRDWERKIPEISNRKALETEEEMLIRTFNFKLRMESVKKYTETRTRELRNLFTFREHPDERLHQIRKILKDIMYTLPYTGDYFFSFFNNRLQSKEDLKSLTDLLGEIQDASTSLHF
ncbi:MAG: CHAD domain-containing protein, partial [Flavitalea sp.]